MAHFAPGLNVPNHIAMDETLKSTLIIWAGFAIVFGPLLTRSSIRRNPVRGGALAHVFHFIGATAIVAVVPTIIAALVFGGGFKLAFPLALTLTLSSLFSLVVFAVVEKPAIRAYELLLDDRGWTEEDARTSGL